MRTRKVWHQETRAEYMNMLSNLTLETRSAMAGVHRCKEMKPDPL
jgi:hypothetical protein